MALPFPTQVQGLDVGHETSQVGKCKRRRKKKRSLDFCRVRTGDLLRKSLVIPVKEPTVNVKETR